MPGTQMNWIKCCCSLNDADVLFPILFTHSFLLFVGDTEKVHFSPSPILLCISLTLFPFILLWYLKDKYAFHKHVSWLISVVGVRAQGGRLSQYFRLLVSGGYN